MQIIQRTPGIGYAESGRIEIRLSTGRVFIIDEDEANGTLEVTSVNNGRTLCAFPQPVFFDIRKSITTVL